MFSIWFSRCHHAPGNHGFPKDNSEFIFCLVRCILLDSSEPMNGRSDGEPRLSSCYSLGNMFCKRPKPASKETPSLPPPLYRHPSSCKHPAITTHPTFDPSPAARTPSKYSMIYSAPKERNHHRTPPTSLSLPTKPLTTLPTAIYRVLGWLASRLGVGPELGMLVV